MPMTSLLVSSLHRASTDALINNSKADDDDADFEVDQKNGSSEVSDRR